ncbi:endonuclease/exonuclease/phosphatase family protein [Paraferrimonas sedimenticola]|nr:endonuclease/exonuclease/phosphatase family protein [Paraferrimonas sedimenticola]
MSLLKLQIVTALLTISVLLGGCGYVAVKSDMQLAGGHYPQQQLESREFGLLVWNIHKETGQRQFQQEFLQSIVALEPDFVLLQEVDLSVESRAWFSELTQYGWEYVANLYQPEFDSYSGVLTQAKVRPDMRLARLTSITEPITDTAKPTLITRYPIAGSDQSLVLVNLHGINFQLTLKAFEQQLGKVQELLGGHLGPVIIAGDFNSWSPQRLQFLEELRGWMSLAQVDFGEQQTELASFMGYPLDHIFYSENYLELIPNSAHVHSNLESSDHRAMSARFHLKNLD